MKRILLCLLLLAPTVQAADKSAAKPAGKGGSSIVTLGWPQLVPESERAKLVNPGSIDHGKGPDRPRGSPLGGGAMGSGGPLTGDDVFNVLENQRSTPVYNPVHTWHNKSVRIPGYIVPIDYNAKGAIISFFLVPYFGACIHVPPPPPNQIIFVRYPKGFDTAALYEPFWISGTLKVETMQSEIAESLYTMQGLRIDPYTKPPG